MTSSSPDLDVEPLLRTLAPHVLGAMVRRFRDFTASEDAVQEALIAAAMQWPRDGLPDNPRGWLVRVAQRRMVDHLRSEASRRNRDAAVAEDTPLAVAPATDGESAIDPDDTLVLLFMCCHPALTSASAIALTLRAVGGLTTAEIAKSFLVPELTIGRRISRAKERIKASGIAFGMPDADAHAERLGSVLHVLYLVFNEGYTTSSGGRAVTACPAVPTTSQAWRPATRACTRRSTDHGHHAHQWRRHQSDGNQRQHPADIEGR